MRFPTGTELGGKSLSIAGPSSRCNARRGAADCQEQRFHEELPHQPSTTCPDGRSHGELMRPRGPASQQQDGYVRACEQEERQRRREDQQEGRHKVGRPACFHQTPYERTHLLRKALRGLLGELVEERLKSLFGHAWIDAPLETGLDAPCEVRIERQMNRNKNL